MKATSQALSPNEEENGVPFKEKERIWGEGVWSRTSGGSEGLIQRLLSDSEVSVGRCHRSVHLGSHKGCFPLPEVLMKPPQAVVTHSR